MEWLAIFQAVTTAISIATKAVAVGKDVAPIVAKVIAILTKGESATQEELDALRAMSDALSDEIQKPLQPEQD